MPGRRRQRRTDASKVDATPPWEIRVRDEPEATSGPFDERDAPEDGIERIDLGALRIPADGTLDVRLDVSETQEVVAATVANPDGQMQIGVFAAPRNEGIWDEVRGEIAASLNSQRKTASTEKPGPLGTELHGNLLDGNRTVPVRFLGVDGPRWFLRAMLTGPAAVDSAKAEPFESVLRQVVVVRGTDPLPVREPVPLKLPPGVELPGSADDPA